MPALLMRLAGPMQAWGTQSRFTVRDTGMEPSKSGVIGLICSALGRPRTKSIEDLCSLKMGVRVDQEGVMKREYQTAGGGKMWGKDYGVINADEKSRKTVTSSRYYLCDADFIVGFQGDDPELLSEIQLHLKNPVWQIFLGRKAFVPSVPVFFPDEIAIVEENDLEKALSSIPWPRQGKPVPEEKKRPERIRFVIEKSYGESPETRFDQPEPFSFSNRRFLPRNVETRFPVLGKDITLREEAT